MPETQTKAELIRYEPIEGNRALLKWQDDHTDHNIATIYDQDDAQGIVDAWNACQLGGANADSHTAFRNDVDAFIQILNAHKAQYAGSQAQRVFAEELCKLENKIKNHLGSFKDPS